MARSNYINKLKSFITRSVIYEKGTSKSRKHPKSLELNRQSSHINSLISSNFSDSINAKNLKKYRKIKNLLLLEEAELITLQKIQIRKNRLLKATNKKRLPSEESIFQNENKLIEKLKKQHDVLKQKLLILEVYSEDGKFNSPINIQLKKNINQPKIIEKNTSIEFPFVLEDSKNKIPSPEKTNKKTLIEPIKEKNKSDLNKSSYLEDNFTNEFIHEQPKNQILSKFNLYIISSIIIIFILIFFLYNTNLEKASNLELNTFPISIEDNLETNNLKDTLTISNSNILINEDSNLETINNEEPKIGKNKIYDNSRLIKKVYCIKKDIKKGFYLVLGTFSELQNAQNFHQTKLQEFPTIIIKGNNYKVCKNVSGTDNELRMLLKNEPGTWLLYNKGL